jgi:DNA (cytosine-5)-methyltransferase 1
MRYLSLFSGIEAASVAWEPLGWECVAVAEVDAFASAVLAHRYPSVPNLGDVTKIDAADLAALGRIDLVVFGSPCQDLSVAGKREGLAGERSGLFHVAVDIVRWAREYCGCRWALWENVPGAFSSNKGRDFAAVVGELAGVDLAVPPKGWGTEGAAVGSEGMVEWAVLDAQWFGVAQRRRRVFALADFGDWASRPPVLLEPQGLRGDSPPRREPGQGASTDVAPGLVSSGRGVERAGETRGQDPVVAVRSISTGDVAHCLNAGGMGRIDYESETMVVEPYTLAIRGREGGATLEARQDGVSNAILTPTGGRSGVGVGAVAFAFDTQQITSAANKTRVSPELPASTLAKASRMHVAYSIMPMNSGKDYKARETDIAQPIMAAGGRIGNQGGRSGVGVGAVAFAVGADCYNGALTGDVAATMGTPGSSVNASGPTVLTQAVCATGEVFHTLRADGFDASEDGTGRGGGAVTLSGLQVRRLTPIECEKLQGFPPGWTAIPYRGKPAADGPRYKSLGNSMAIPVVSWIGRQIEIAESGLT